MRIVYPHKLLKVHVDITHSNIPWTSDNILHTSHGKWIPALQRMPAYQLTTINLKNSQSKQGTKMIQTFLHFQQSCSLATSMSTDREQWMSRRKCHYDDKGVNKEQIRKQLETIVRLRVRGRALHLVDEERRCNVQFQLIIILLK